MEHIEKLEWLLKSMHRIRQEKWSGSITLHFHKGNMSRKFNRYSIEYLNPDAPIEGDNWDLSR